MTIPEAFKDDSEYDTDTKTVSMSLKEGSSFEITTTSNSALIISKTYAGGGIVKGYDWISISDPDITLGANGISTYKYTATLTKPYLAGRYPKAAIRCISLTDASESILYVEALSVPQPIATQQPPKTPNNRSDNPNNFDVDKLEASLYRITGSTTRVYINCPDGVEPAEHPDWLDVTPASVDGASTLFLLTLNNRDLPVDGNQGTVVFCNKKKNELQTGITVNIMDAPVKTDYTAVGSDNTYTPGTSDGTTPDDLAIRIKENSSATVKASSIDGVEVKIDYPEGTPEWLSFTEATATTATTTAVATKATASLQTQDITFKPIERSMGGAQKATVTLVNIIGGKNYSFTVTPVYATPVLSVISTSAQPAQNTFVAGDDASTLTLYRVSGSTIQLKATAIGGSRATDPAGVTVSGGDTYQTENTYTVTLAAGATSGSFNIVNKSDPAKIHTVTVQAPVATITSKNVTLAVNLNQTATAATSSPEGFTASVTNWGGGGAWFDLPTKDFGKNNVNVTVKVNASLGNIGIKPATVTLKNKIAGGGDITFTVTPTLGTPAVKRVSAIPTGNTPATNNATLGNNTTLTLYKLATATNYVLSATCYGGSKAVMSGSGFTLSPNNSVSTNVTQNYTLTATATSGSGSVTIYNADSKNPVTFPVSIKNGVMTLDKSEITLTPANGSAQGLKLTSGAGYKSYSVNWNGGSGWFGLPSSVAGGTNVAFNVTANTANSNPKEATVTLVNAIEGAPNLTNLKVKVGATAPKVTSYSNPSITTATAVSANTGSGTNVELWAVDNSSIQVTIDAIGGSCVYSQTNVNVTGGNTTNQQNTFTITSTNGSQGNFVIANKIAPNLDKLTFTVKKKADAISANNLSVTAALSGATNISVNSNLGCTASVLNNNWGSGGGQWFNFKTADVNYGNNKTIQIEQLSTNNNTIMKPVTIRLTSKASGGATKDITVTPTGFAAPTLSATSGSDADFYLNKGTTFTFTTTSVGGGTDATTSNSDVATVTRTNNTYTVTPKGLGSCTISVPNASNTNLKSNYTVTISGKVNYQGKAVWKYYGFYIAPEDAGSSVWNTSLTANYCSNKSGATWYVPSADEWRAILGGTSGSNNAASTVYNEYRRKGVFTTNLHYWSTTENDDDSTYAYDMRIYNTNAYVTYYYKAASRQVRCVSR